MTDNQQCEHLDQAVMDNLKVKVNDFPELEMAAETFAMFGDLSRLRILYILYETGQCCVYHLAEMMGMGVSAVSHHLRKLRDRKLVKKQRDGLNIYYSIAAGEEATSACKIARRILEVAKSD